MATLTVTSTADSGSGSLREAIANAQQGDTIVFDPSLANQTITLTSALMVDKNLTIDGEDAPGLTISGNQETIIFNLTGDNREFTVRDLTLTDAFHEYAGGAIWVQGANSTITVENSEFNNNVAGQGRPAIWAKNSADVTVINSKFDGNRATEDVDSAGGAISVFEKSELTVQGSEFTNNEGFAGGAISTIFTALTVEDSTFIGNESRSWGGAINNDGASVPNQERYYSGDLPTDSEGGETVISDSYFEGNVAVGFGGAIAMWGYDQDTVTIDNTTIINNEVTESSNGTAKGGGLFLMGYINITDSTIANNTSEDIGGGLYYQGGVPATITNTTFSGNVADAKGGAIYSDQWESETEVVNTTFADNSAGEAGAIYKNNRPLTVTNSIFANNTAEDAGSPNQQTNEALAGENNIQSPNTGNDATENITIADPKISALQDVDGVLLHTLLPDSPAIDAGTTDGAPSTDQTGAARPQDGDLNGSSLPDIGAYEFAGTNLETTPTNPPETTPTNPPETTPTNPPEDTLNPPETTPTNPPEDTLNPPETTPTNPPEDTLNPPETTPTNPPEDTLNPPETTPTNPPEDTLNPPETTPTNPPEDTLNPPETTPTNPSEDTLNPINGSDISETITGSDKSDRMNGLGGQDLVTGGLGNDQLDGSEGHDRLWGDDGDDLLAGGEGHDQLYGGANRDAIAGSAGNDQIYGDAGDDLLNGGSGNDALTGGEGRDTFVFGSGQGIDIIRDFTLGEDKLSLAEGTSLENLSIGQTGCNTTIVDEKGQPLVQLAGVDASLLTEQTSSTFV